MTKIDSHACFKIFLGSYELEALGSFSLLIKDNPDVMEDMYKSISFKLCYKIFELLVFLAQ